VTALDNEFLLVSRRGRGLSQVVRDRLLEVLYPKPVNHRRISGTTKGK
jgi:hypothetical protein